VKNKCYTVTSYGDTVIIKSKSGVKSVFTIKELEKHIAIEKKWLLALKKGFKLLSK
jgi:hypothetical protein